MPLFLPLKKTPTNEKGELVWRTYIGGASEEEGRGLAVEGDNVYMVGRTTSSDFPNNNTVAGTWGDDDTFSSGGEGFVTRVNDNGGCDFSTYFGHDPDVSAVYAIKIGGNGKIYIAGTGRAFEPDLPLTQFAFIACFSAGFTNYDWSTHTLASEIWALDIDDDNNVYSAGKEGFGSGIPAIYKHNSDGSNQIWANNPTNLGNGLFNDMMLDEDGNVIACGKKIGTTNDGLIRKLNGANGNPIGNDIVLGVNSGDDEYYNVETDFMGNMYFTGRVGISPITPNPNLDWYHQPEKAGENDALIVAYPPSTGAISGAFWVTYFGGEQNDFASALYREDNLMYMVGESRSGCEGNGGFPEFPTRDLNNNSYSDSSNPGNNAKGFIAMFDFDFVLNANSPIKTNQLWNIYPNPSNGSFVMQSSYDKAFSVKIFNSIGVKVYEISIAEHNTFTEFDLSKYPKGIYFITLEGEGVNESHKIMIH